MGEREISMSAKDVVSRHGPAGWTAPRLVRPLAIAGLAGLLVGAIDPLEGSVLVVAGALLATCGAWVGRSPHRRQLAWALGCLAAGVAALWSLSAVGGIGGASGHSNWWGLLLVPYPIGWVLTLVGVFRVIRDAG
jgi:hypothetical protein